MQASVLNSVHSKSPTENERGVATDMLGGDFDHRQDRLSSAIVSASRKLSCMKNAQIVLEDHL
jgi:hypothetical protein